MDEGKAKIPKLKFKLGEVNMLASSNKEKSIALAKCFFPTKLQDRDVNEEVKYLKACKGVGKVMREQIHKQLRRIKPCKALGPNGIPNTILSNCADIIVDRLYYIFGAMLEKGLQYKP